MKQPRSEKLVMAGATCFEIVVRLALGERVAVPLGRASIQIRPHD